MSELLQFFYQCWCLNLLCNNAEIHTWVRYSRAIDTMELSPYLLSTEYQPAFSKIQRILNSLPYILLLCHSLHKVIFIPPSFLFIWDMRVREYIYFLTISPLVLISSLKYTTIELADLSLSILIIFYCIANEHHNSHPLLCLVKQHFSAKFSMFCYEVPLKGGTNLGQPKLVSYRIWLHHSNLTFISFVWTVLGSRGEWKVQYSTNYSIRNCFLLFCLDYKQ